ncbi:MAG: PPC domain-containing protein [Pirellulales bacterium]
MQAQLARAVEPVLNEIVPAGFQRGTEVDVQFKGVRLEDAEEALFYSPGLTVKSWEAAGNVVKAKLAVAADCRLGIHAVRLRSATGVGNLRLFSIGAFPEVAEVEPNNLFETPQAIALGTTVAGVVQTEDVDYFVVEAKAGQRITAEIEGLRLGYTSFDPYLAILNEKRFELARLDDASLLLQDCVASIVAPEDGKYVIQLRESSYGGDGTGRYRLHVGSYPRPLGVYPAGGRPGETLEIKCLGDVGGEFAAKVTLPSDGSSTHAFYAQNEQGIAPSPNQLRVVDLPNVLETEPNNAHTDVASAVPAPVAFNGIIQTDGDVDWFKFSAKKGEQYDVRVHARGTLRSPLDPVLSINNDKGNQIASNDDSGGMPDSYLKFAVPNDGDYYVSIRDHLKSGGPTYVYRVEVTPIKPSLTVNLPERQQYVPTLLNVPRGNRMALMVALQRQNFGGEAGLELRGAPNGLTAEPLPFVGGNTLVPVLFSATPDAAPSGALVEMLAKSRDPNQPAEGRFYQRSMLIRGQNNKDVYGHDADRMAAAITKEVPFKLEIVAPTAPLVRDGQIDLKVTAARVGEFKGPISIALLYNPAGVASSGSIVIPEGKNEAVIPLTANNGAALGTHKIIVVGRTVLGGGTVECSTGFADLTITDSFFSVAFQKAAVELGQSTDVLIKAEKKADFPGKAKVELVGLPAGTTSTPIEIASGAEELVFKVVTDPAVAKPAKYTSLICRTTFEVNGMTVIQNQGTGELRIDAPLPPKPNAPAAAAPITTVAKPAEPKRLNRLEMLRQQKDEK